MIRPGEQRIHPAPRPWFDHTDTAALHAAFATLEAGCRHLIAREAGSYAARDAKVAMRVAGNHLKELDRFFTLLIAEYRAFLREMAPRTRPDLHPLCRHRPRLRAIRRLQDVACHGPVRNHCAMSARDLATASMGAAGGRQAAGLPFALDAAAVGEIARFYLMLAEEILAPHP